MTELKRPTLPAGTNPLAKALGKRLAIIRTKEGLDIAAMAKQLGLPYKVYEFIEAGRLLPSPIIANRLYNWMFGTTYEDVPLARAREVRAELRESDTVRVDMEKTAISNLAREASRLGLSQSALAEVFILRGLANKAGLATMKEAVAEIEKAKYLAAMKEAPEIRDILTMDIDLAVKAGKNKTHVNKIAKPAIEKLTNLLDFEQVEELE